MERFLKFLGLKRGKKLYQLDVDLLEAVEDLAKNERKPVEAMAEELIQQAIDHRAMAEQSLALWHGLTRREQQVVALMCLGYMNKEIAERLFISTETVKSHVSNALRKFGVRRRMEIQRILADWDFSQWERKDTGGSTQQ